MLNLGRVILFVLASLSALNASLTACECCCCCEEPSNNRLYIGAFGGGIYSNSNKMSQYGTAFFSEVTSIGPLSIIADGNLNKTSCGFGGVQVGYEWSRPCCCSGWYIATAGELETLFFRHKKKGHLINQTVIGLEEHDFFNSFRLNANVILANLVVSLNSDCLCGFSPYVGGGIGATRLSLHKADSLQVEPPEEGVNHFNSDRNDASWAFAAQAKAGLRFNFCSMFHIFAEYRYLFVDRSNYIFGATNYLAHVPTSAWNVKLKNANYNAFAIGVQFDL